MFNLLRNCFAFPYPIPSIFPNSSLLCDASSFPISPFLIKSTCLNSSLFSVLSVLTLSSAAEVPGCKHAFLPREEAKKDGDIGIENASPKSSYKLCV